MKKGMKLLSLVIVAGMILALLSLAGCKKNEAEPEEKKTQQNTSAAVTEKVLEPVELIYYIYGAFPMKDQDEVFQALNDIIKKEINATLDIKATPAGEFNERMKIVQASGEPYDMCFTSNWRNDYLTGVANGAYLPLDDLIPQYASKAYAQIPEDFWKAVQVKDRIYGFINYQIVARNQNINFLKEIVEDIGLDVDKLTSELKNRKLDTLYDFYDRVHAKYPNMIFNTFAWASSYEYFGMEYIINTQVPGAVRIGEETAINQFDTQEFKEYLEMGKSLNEKDYFGGDTLATTKDINALMTAKQLLNQFSGTNKPGMSQIQTTQKKVDILSIAGSENYITTGTIMATLTGINRASKNPERAMMYLELINTDKVLFNIFVHGIEGKHWEKTGTPNVIKKLDASKDYSFNSGWQIGNDFNQHVLEGMPVDTPETTKKMNDEAKKSDLLGFVFDSANVANEIAQCLNVYQEYGNGFQYGLLDMEKNYPEFLNKLNTAGAQKIVDEINRQIQEWKKNK